VIFHPEHVPLFAFAAAAKNRQQDAHDLFEAVVVVRLSVQDNLLCKTYLIWAEAATVFLLGRIQIDGQLVAETKILVPLDKDCGDRPDDSSVSSQES